MIYIHNTLSNKKELFVPQTPNTVRFYVCGVTVYDHSHIGHARAYVTFDCIRRHLIKSGYNVTYIQNFTDIDDKIIAKAQDEQLDINTLTHHYTESYLSDMAALNIMPATHYPKATDHISQMHVIIQSLLDQNIAYITSQGDVCFNVDQCRDYGKLSKKVLSELDAGHRVDINNAKHNPFDFVLWKRSKPNEPSWDSPWGPGRPGWHIECSAMALHHLGHTIDIHGGGEDLMFPHHENEIAQSECHTHQPFANYWIHNGFVTINNTKMSKSLKNTFTIKEILDDFSGETLRFYLLKAHYKTPFNFSLDGLKESDVALKKLHDTLRNYSDPDDLPNELNQYKTRFINALNDDFNVAEAIGILFELAKYIHINHAGVTLLRELGEHIGLFFSDTSDRQLAPDLLALLNERTAARLAKDYQKADTLRAKLAAHGIEVKDTSDGSSWSYIK